MTNFVNDNRERTSPSRGVPITDAFEDAAAFQFDTKTLFEKWLHLVDRGVSQTHSECEVTFEGVLQVDSIWRNNIRSAYGTLVMTEQGHIEGDIEVRVASIDGYVRGNLRASEQVVLERNARVSGNIYTPSLVIRDGAFFDGHSFSEPTISERSSSKIGEFHVNSSFSRVASADV